MRKFEDYLKVIFKHEGGLVDNPADPGGPTNMGISLMFLKGLPLSIADIDHDGDIDGDDIRKLTKEEAGELYRKYFWDKMNLAYIQDESLKLHLFDMGVNAGNKTAVKLLQNILIVPADGILGKTTANAVNNYDGDLLADYIRIRKEYYMLLVKNKPSLKIFLKGWLYRVHTCKFD